MTSVKEKNFVSIVIHLKENLELLNPFITELEGVFSQSFENYEYIIVNNNPEHDLTNKIISTKGSVNIINLSWKHNLEDAMRAGIDMSIGDFIFEFDNTEMDYNSQFIMEVYNKCLTGFDAVAATPKIKKGKSSKLFYNALNKFSNNKVELVTESFRVVSRRMLNRAAKSQETFRYRKVNYHYSGLNTAILPYDIQGNKYKGKKEFRRFERYSLGSSILIYYSNIGTKISMFLSIFFFFLSIIVGAFAIFSYFYKIDSIQEGWTTTMLFLSLSFSGLFVILTVISKYLEVLLKEVLRDLPYTYKSIDKIQ